jgi:MoxR-like ATPase
VAITQATQTVVAQMGKITQNVVKAMLAERDALEKLAYNTTSNLTLVGPPGTGKSSMPRAIAAYQNLEAYPVQCSDQMSGASFFQIAWVEADGTMSVRKGPGLTAFEDGGLLIVEEINEASQDALGVLTMLLVKGHGATVRTMDNRLITIHQKARAICTMNGDPYDLPERILDRAPAMPIACPSAAMIRALPPDLGRLTTRAYAAVHETGLSEGLPFTYRQMQALGEFRQQTPDLKLAALVAFNGDREKATLFTDTLLPLVAAPSGTRQSTESAA